MLKKALFAPFFVLHNYLKYIQLQPIGNNKV